ncbi:MAG: LysM peptidoglycan-binding domain-containing protein [Lactobacillus sp.]|nr:LysM peptidoglycan-binding domain-containing protein [Lactobacillus sp.]
MAYSFYLDNTVLPIAPSKFSVSIQNKNKTVELINDKQINILKLPGLTDISFEFVLPNSKYPFVVNWQPPQYYLSVLEKLKVNLQPFQFVIARSLPNGQPSFATNMSVSLESYEILEDTENGLDITVKVNLKQYRPYATQTVEIKTSVDGSKVSVEKNARAQTKQPDKTYTVQKGDTLWNIAKKYLGDGSKYKQLATLNNISNPNFLSVGQVLKLS